MSDYEDLTDCPTCPQLATDRDDALSEVEALRSENQWLRANGFGDANTPDPDLATPAERRVLDAVANWRPNPHSSGALMRLMEESYSWLADREATS